MNQATPVTPIPSATVVLLRDRTPCLEVLLLLRNQSLTFAPGQWVFPGGRIDPGDYQHPDQSDHPDHSGDDDNPEVHQQAARRAACREAYEEAGVVVSADTLQLIDHFITPAAQPRRFTTWFYLADANHCDDVIIDDGEIVDHQWIQPEVALQQHHQGALSLMRPTRKVLEKLDGVKKVIEALTLA